MTRFPGSVRPAARVLVLLFLVAAPTGVANAAAPAGDVRIHYHRDAGDGRLSIRWTATDST